MSLLLTLSVARSKTPAISPASAGSSSPESGAASYLTSRGVVEVVVPTDVWLLIFALATSLLAGALAYSASPRQRWLRVPLPAFPTLVSAVLAAIVGFRAWAEALHFVS